MDVKHLSDFLGFSAEKLQKHNLFQSERFFLDVYCLAPATFLCETIHKGLLKMSFMERSALTALCSLCSILTSLAVPSTSC